MIPTSAETKQIINKAADYKVASYLGEGHSS